VGRLILHAPGVHTGGGLVLLKELMSAASPHPLCLNLDARVRDMSFSQGRDDTYYINPTLLGRVCAEYHLFRQAVEEDIILCFHGLPPLLPTNGKVVVFVQNRYHLEANGLSLFHWKTRLRLILERLICRFFRHNVDEYIVQTASMSELVSAWHGGEPKVRTLPFYNTSKMESSKERGRQNTEYDFVYVSSSEGHKNHANLLRAWIFLAREGIRPRLCLTIPEENAHLLDEIDKAKKDYNLDISNVGYVSHQDAMDLYKSASALIYPSFSESFGLPLMEAQNYGLPILASERDYVRDVCDPIESFDPSSPKSISRAVKRFLGIQELSCRASTASEFLKEICK